jgi:methyl-accepting chemotaxis protein
MSAVFSRFDRLSFRIPMIAIAGAFVASAAVGVSSHIASTAALLDTEKDMLTGISGFRAEMLGRIGESFAAEMKIFAGSPATQTAFVAFQQAYKGVEGGGQALLAHYASRKPPTGEKLSDYIGQDDRSPYGEAHRRWHGFMKSANSSKGYYDMFLISPAGDVIYTVEKESDFGSNLKTGKLRDSGLGRAFEGALAMAGKRDIHFEDYSAYAPSNGDPAAFIAKAIINDAGETIGVAAIQLPSEAVSATLAKPFGHTGTAYAVGDGNLLRSQLKNRPPRAILSELPENAIVKEAFAGNKTFGSGTSVDGRPALLATTPVDFLGKRWVVVTEIHASEFQGPITWMGQKNALVSLLVLLCVSIGAIFMARRISRPVGQMAEAVGRLASGENAEIPGQARRDELGDLARSLNQVHAMGVSAARIRSGLDRASANVMIADMDGRVIYANEALLAFFRDNAAAFRQAFPGLKAEDMMGAMLKQLDDGPRAGSEAGRTRLNVDQLTIEIAVNPVVNDKGERLGMIAEWRDLTAELAAMSEVTAVVDAATRGDFSARIREDDKQGVVRDLASGQNRINTLIEAAMEDFSTTLQRVSEGDLVVRVAQSYEGRFGQLAGGINDTVAKLSETVATIQRTAKDIASAASEINAGATDLAKRTEDEAASLEETAATTEELAASVKQTADSSRSATTLSDKARSVASEGGAVVAEAIGAIERIEQASSKISDIIGVIDDIAFQTNLLALNAAVEAARAGEAGKGFAVVASEVRTLAQRSGQAARDIKGLIVDSSQQVVEGVRLVHETGAALKNIVNATTQVAETVILISSATSEQANGIEEMSNAVARIDEMTQQNSALAEQSAASASELIRQIDTLNTLVSAFRIERTRAVASARPAAPAVTEPDRLQQLARQAFAQSKVDRSAAPQRAPRQLAVAAGGGRGEWAEF